MAVLLAFVPVDIFQSREALRVSAIKGCPSTSMNDYQVN